MSSSTRLNVFNSVGTKWSCIILYVTNFACFARILWHPSGQYLSSASEVGAVAKTIYPTSTHGKLLITAVTPSGVHLFGHRPDHFAGHSLVACLFADNSSLLVYLKLRASLLPPSTRQPGPVAVLLGQTLKLSLIFHQSLTLFWLTEKCRAAACPKFSSAL